jgi:hypothetical protein
MAGDLVRRIQRKGKGGDEPPNLPPYICHRPPRSLLGSRGGPTWYSMVFIEYQLFLEKTGYIYIVYTSCVFN